MRSYRRDLRELVQMQPVQRIYMLLLLLELLTPREVRQLQYHMVQGCPQHKKMTALQSGRNWERI